MRPKEEEPAATVAAPEPKRTRLDKFKEEWRKELLQELREGHWVVPDDEEEAPGQALRKQELLEELEQRKAIKDQCLHDKRELKEERQLGQEISDLEEGSAAFHKAKADIAETVRKLNKLHRG
ncbi:uncharacterized protein NFIA_026800 [Aspergillus fischeri NRRL 181]|uniref:Uncharacterized protein n=1 Tax=Neosartorya fischeri (strain ATCC 1020 / DSM 3700 / CBS 544.65 / FGSC A1164 / JCM 1740 / NRRL 181 / WB 181) TaxID=331117 RepID=A1DCP6_NEOFI|nr:uncharacterized protein NFIA_026800 [Aspergillus fischeri NRRL 181]EAW19606.1 hypothetical protein NFIA_026800 [Aspergillus fischeri NRRL 181]